MANPARPQDFVRGVPLFAGLLPSEFDRVAMVMHPRAVAGGTAICTQGEPGDEMFVIVDGEAVVERVGQPVAKLTTGDYFGELALLDHGPRTATVRALTDMNLYVLRERSLTALLMELPALALKLLANLASRLREAEA
ncbi:MAG TPA: cyclic nucleotide-binding domain-containing protein [Acidimicrobiales bacterium]|nr:cyclic nucleotide-binding domain-containing protein [Acidimicrobiales bacterium]